MSELGPRKIHQCQRNSLVDSKERLRKLASVDIDVNRYPLSHLERAELTHLMRASDAIDEIFWQQSCPNVAELRTAFATEFAKDQSLLEYFDFNYGPYDRLAGNEPFLPVRVREAGAGFYPPGLSKDTLLGYLKSHPNCADILLSPYTIVCSRNGDLTAVPYHHVYSSYLKRAAAELLHASSFEQRQAHRRYLKERAKGLTTGEYAQSEVQWIDLPPNGLDIVIGPYELYEDSLMGVKASYEAMVTYQDPVEAAKVQCYVDQLMEFESYITHRMALEFSSPGLTTPLVIADLLYSGGDARKGIPSTAFTLPNDDTIIAKKGTKEVILRNLLQAKFERVIIPIGHTIAKNTFNEEAIEEGYLLHTVLHEISHALGPHAIDLNGEKTTVNRCLRDLHTTFEEAKADVLGACWLIWLDKSIARIASPPRLTAYLLGLVRVIRFGQAQAHARGALLQFNYLVAMGGIEINGEGLPKIAPTLIEEGLFALAHDLLQVQMRGNYDEAKRMTDIYCQQTPLINHLMRTLQDVPIDIRISVLA